MVQPMRSSLTVPAGLVNPSGFKLLKECPLREVSVQASMGSELANVSVRHRYENRSGRNLEAVYQFPLPDLAHITGFEITCNGSRIHSVIEPKDDAEKRYQQALREGKSAYMLESEREDVFRLHIGNLAPSDNVVIDIHYSQDIEAIDGEIRWRFPAVLAPRYSPASQKSGKKSVEPADAGKADYPLTFSAKISGLPGLGSITSPSHPIQQYNHEMHTIVELKGNEHLMDRDLILLIPYEDAGGSIVFTGQTDGAVVEALLRFKPDLSSFEDDFAENLTLSPKRYDFLLDISGSMHGEKLTHAKNAMKLALRNLMAGDHFQLIAFESNFSTFSRNPVPFNQNTLEQADWWIDQLQADGGTEILRPLQEVLKRTGDEPDGMEHIVFLFTDGQVSNEGQIYALIERTEDVRIFPMGIDTAVNETFIRRIAESGNGIAEFVYPGERTEDKLIRQFQAVLQPYYIGLQFESGSGVTYEPAKPWPGIYMPGEQILMPFRIAHTGVFPKQIVVTAVNRQTGKNVRFTVDTLQPSDAKRIRQVWAKATILELERQLADRLGAFETGLRNEIIRTSVQSGVLSTLTALIAVYDRPSARTGELERVKIPVALPHQWDEDDSSEIFCSNMLSLNINTFEDNFTIRHSRIQPVVSSISYNQQISFFDNLSHVDEADSIERRIQALIQSQHADGTIGGDAEKTAILLLILILTADGKKRYYIPYLKASEYIRKQASIGWIELAQRCLIEAPSPDHGRLEEIAKQLNLSSQKMQRQSLVNELLKRLGFS